MHRSSTSLAAGECSALPSLSCPWSSRHCVATFRSALYTLILLASFGILGKQWKTFHCFPQKGSMCDGMAHLCIAAHLVSGTTELVLLHIHSLTVMVIQYSASLQILQHYLSQVGIHLVAFYSDVNPRTIPSQISGISWYSLSKWGAMCWPLL